ncbi:MAG TPA: hypothetical protein PK467_02115, partial [Candidatus Wallbacteria bacterium]|nr:hypothetical protein [Candidatus Wallbacteria bacterium]
MKIHKIINIFSGSLLLVIINLASIGFCNDAQNVRAAYERYIKSYAEFKDAAARGLDEQRLRICTSRYLKDLEAYRKLISGGLKPENSYEDVKSPAQPEDYSGAQVAEPENRLDIQSIISQLRSAETPAQKDSAIARLEEALASAEGAEAGEARLALGEAYMARKEYAKAAAVFDILIKSQVASGAGIQKKASALKKKCELNDAYSKAYAAMIHAENKYDGIAWTNPFAKLAAKLACAKASAEYNFARARLAASSLFETASGGSDNDGPVINSGCAPLITGAFFQFSGGHNDEKDYPVEYWKKEIAAMKKIGMDIMNCIPMYQI